MELIKQYNAVSFIDGRSRKGAESVQLVIELLCKSVIEGIAITREDIKELYWIYRSKGKDSARFEVSWFKYEEVSKGAFMADWRTERNALGWFKNNLANAILQGKILILPIINI